MSNEMMSTNFSIKLQHPTCETSVNGCLQIENFPEKVCRYIRSKPVPLIQPVCLPKLTTTVLLSFSLKEHYI